MHSGININKLKITQMNNLRIIKEKCWINFNGNNTLRDILLLFEDGPVYAGYIEMLLESFEGVVVTQKKIRDILDLFPENLIELPNLGDYPDYIWDIFEILGGNNIFQSEVYYYTYHNAIDQVKIYESMNSVYKSLLKLRGEILKTNLSNLLEKNV